MATTYVSPVTGTWAAKSSSPFGAGRGDAGRHHAGNDLQAKDGSSAVAVIGGKVLYVKNDPGGYDHYAIVQGDDGNMYRYAPHASISVKVGQQIGQGDTIGKIGRGHLHFEVAQPSDKGWKSLKAGGDTQWWGKDKPRTTDPAKFFGVEKGAVIAAGRPVRGVGVAAGVPPADIADTGKPTMYGLQGNRGDVNPAMKAYAESKGYNYVPVGDPGATRAEQTAALMEATKNDQNAKVIAFSQGGYAARDALKQGAPIQEAMIIGAPGVEGQFPGVDATFVPQMAGVDHMALPAAVAKQYGGSAAALTGTPSLPPAQQAAADVAAGLPPSAPGGPPRVLRKGATDAKTGGAVTRLQQQLAASGFDVGAVDGKFGRRTEAAVRAAEKQYNLPTRDRGIAGPQVQAALEANAPRDVALPRQRPDPAGPGAGLSAGAVPIGGPLSGMGAPPPTGIGRSDRAGGGVPLVAGRPDVPVGRFPAAGARPPEQPLVARQDINRFDTEAMAPSVAPSGPTAVTTSSIGPDPIYGDDAVLAATRGGVPAAQQWSSLQKSDPTGGQVDPSGEYARVMIPADAYQRRRDLAEGTFAQFGPNLNNPGMTGHLSPDSPVGGMAGAGVGFSQPLPDAYFSHDFGPPLPPLYSDEGVDYGAAEAPMFGGKPIGGEQSGIVPFGTKVATGGPDAQQWSQLQRPYPVGDALTQAQLGLTDTESKMWDAFAGNPALAEAYKQGLGGTPPAAPGGPPNIAAMGQRNLSQLYPRAGDMPVAGYGLRPGEAGPGEQSVAGPSAQEVAATKAIMQSAAAGNYDYGKYGPSVPAWARGTMGGAPSAPPAASAPDGGPSIGSLPGDVARGWGVIGRGIGDWFSGDTPAAAKSPPPPAVPAPSPGAYDWSNSYGAGLSAKPYPSVAPQQQGSLGNGMPVKLAMDRIAPTPEQERLFQTYQGLKAQEEKDHPTVHMQLPQTRPVGPTINPFNQPGTGLEPNGWYPQEGVYPPVKDPNIVGPKYQEASIGLPGAGSQGSIGQGFLQHASGYGPPAAGGLQGRPQYASLSGGVPVASANPQPAPAFAPPKQGGLSDSGGDNELRGSGGSAAETPLFHGQPIGGELAGVNTGPIGSAAPGGVPFTPGGVGSLMNSITTGVLGRTGEDAYSRSNPRVPLNYTPVAAAAQEAQARQALQSAVKQIAPGTFGGDPRTGIPTLPWRSISGAPPTGGNYARNAYTGPQSAAWNIYTAPGSSVIGGGSNGVSWSPSGYTPESSTPYNNNIGQSVDQYGNRVTVGSYVDSKGRTQTYSY